MDSYLLARRQKLNNIRKQVATQENQVDVTKSEPHEQISLDSVATSVEEGTDDEQVKSSSKTRLEKELVELKEETERAIKRLLRKRLLSESSDN